MSLKLHLLPQSAKHRRQSGSALVIAVFVLLFGSLILLALARLSTASGTSLIYEVQGQRSYWLAKSTLELGLVQLFPLNQTAQSCAAVNTGMRNWNSSDWVGCQSQLSCREDTIDSKKWFRLVSTAQCGDGDLLTSRVLSAEASE
ncbi:type II secretory pathway component [Rheinheimera texasensis]|uniref:type II secretory pathway component n=1 Tax=Rheinheimera texasensis TaxID=306205 RepID=UPI0032B10A8F